MAATCMLTFQILKDCHCKPPSHCHRHAGGHDFPFRAPLGKLLWMCLKKMLQQHLRIHCWFVLCCLIIPREDVCSIGWWVAHYGRTTRLVMQHVERELGTLAVGETATKDDLLSCWKFKCSLCMQSVDCRVSPQVPKGLWKQRLALNSRVSPLAELRFECSLRWVHNTPLMISLWNYQRLVM